MPSSSKAKATPQPSLQKTTSATSATRQDNARSANNPKGSMKSVPHADTTNTKAGLGGDMTHLAKDMATLKTTANIPANDVTPAAASGGVNRKKQKRREKQAARLAAEQRLNNGYASGDLGRNGHLPYMQHGIADGGAYNGLDFDDPEQYGEGEDLYYTDDEGRLIPATNGDHAQRDSSKKSKKKKKAKNASPTQPSLQNHQLEGSSTSLSTPSASIRPPPPPPPPLSNAALRATQKFSRDRIWNTSTAEERERIKEFWLSLGEEERRSLVKVEKEAVLRKMKEQQKHSCSCTVCGRKRTAIEEELEVLYDAYYEELEQYANHNQGFGDGAPIMPPPRMYNNPLPKAASDRMSHLVNTQLPSRGKVTEPSDDEDADDEEDDYEDDDGDYSEEDLDDDIPPATDFFTFGNSLTVKEGILTVADDLLKNDGRKFIDMMEQLAERRMQREEETQYAASALAHQSMHAGHNHGPPLEEDDFEDDEDDEDYASEEDDYEEDDMEAMTEEQRMEEGRRMFQIFAARMFEQRVLTAYREKVSRERQQKLIEELEEESRVDAQREEKKAREAQKKKDKKKLQKQAKEEAHAKREAEKAAEEARVKAIEEKKQEEQRQRKEEQRKKKEAEKKAQEEERLKKEAEKQKRLQDERDRQAEAERKQKEAKEREKKKRDDAKKKEREEREAKEKEARERKANEESERKAREEQIRKDREEKARKERDSTVKSEKEAKDRMSHAKREEIAAHQLAQTIATQKRPSQQMPVHLPPGLHPPQGPPNLQSPHFQVATPVVPKAPTPVRQRQSSQQGSHASSPRSQQAVTDSSHSASPLNTGLSQGSIPPTPASSKSQSSQPPLIHPQPSAPMSPIRQSGRTGSSGFSFDNMPPTSAPMMPPGMPPRAPMGHDMPMYQNPPQIAPQYRNFLPNGMPPPGINGIRNMSQGRGFPVENHANYSMQAPSSMAPSMPAAQNSTREPTRSQPHSRQQSASFDKPVLENINTAPTQPIGRPAPIKRPSSTAPAEKTNENNQPIRSEMDELSTQLGSSALLDDTDVPLTSNMTDSMNATAHPGAPGSGRLGFGASPLFPDPMGPSKIDNHNFGGHGGHGSTWNNQLPFGASGLTGAPTWGNTPGWTANNNVFGIVGGPHRPHASRPVTVRLMVSQACKHLTAKNPSSNGYHDVRMILREVDLTKPHNEPSVSDKEIMDIFDTEGNMQNGGGSFDVRNDGGVYIAKFEPDSSGLAPTGRGGMAPGDIGSPIPSSSMPAFGGMGSRQPFQSSPPTGF